MQLPDGYLDALSDELSPFGFDLGQVCEDADGIAISFRTDPASFVRRYPDLGIEESYGKQWPPAELTLWLRYSRGGDPVEFVFETVDLLTQTASSDRELRDRLNTVADPADHAEAVGEALSLALTPPDEQTDYFE